MAKWKQLLAPPAGALPANVVTKVAVAVIAGLMTLLVLVQMLGGGDEDGGPAGAAVNEAGVAGSGLVGRVEVELGRLREEQRQARERAAALAAEEAARERERAAALAAAAAAAPAPPPPAAAGSGGIGATLPAAQTEGELALRETLRLEALERRARSLRAPSVVQTTRGQERPAGAAAGGPLEQIAGQLSPGAAQAPAGGAVAAPAMSAIVEQLQAASALVNQGLGGGGGEADAGPAPRAVPGVTGPPVEAAAAPVMVTVPDDPAGHERVYEGSLLSAVLVTQLSGEFAGSVLAQVSIPFYSADRQRILVPRGTRLLGTAQPVQDRDQSRLAVGFHRLVWPDGRWVDLAFHGLNAIGESALADQVNRHYVSMFAAAGAVGLLAGLTLQGSNPYAGGLDGFRAGAGQGFGQSATQILQRFLNRLPTITIRAGHRLRVWVTSDFLVPRPRPHPERMFR